MIKSILQCYNRSTAGRPTLQTFSGIATKTSSFSDLEYRLSKGKMTGA